VARTKLLAFAIAAAIAGIGGVTHRWARALYVDVTDDDENVCATLAFDYSDGGVP
jgi:ABC-type uncharacterized transport system permease subunit